MSSLSVLTAFPPTPLGILSSLYDAYGTASPTCLHTTAWFYTATWYKAGNGCPFPYHSFTGFPIPRCIVTRPYATGYLTDFWTCTVGSAYTLSSNFNGGTFTTRDLSAVTQGGGTVTVTVTDVVTQTNTVTVRTTLPSVTSTTVYTSTVTKNAVKRDIAMMWNVPNTSEPKQCLAASDPQAPIRLFRRACSLTTCAAWCCEFQLELLTRTYER